MIRSAANTSWRTAFMIVFLLTGFHGLAWDFPNENRVYDPRIHTVMLYKAGFEMASPVITLHSDEELSLSFDDLNVSLKGYRYTIMHCTSEWETSPDLMVTDYIDGIREENIDDYAYSFNTTVEYIHYSALFPGSYMKPRISGNYLLIVYVDTPEQPSFTRRFMVVERAGASVNARVIQADAPEWSFSHQQVDFVVNIPGFQLSNPEREINIVITQNGRWDNALHHPKFRFYRGTQLDFTFDPTLIFAGGNEFRFVDIKSLQYQTENIRNIDWDGAYQVYLLEDKSRARRPYILEKDINGRMVVESDQYVQQSSVEADYAWVHFSIPSSQIIPGGKLYIMGALTDFRMAPPNEMVYNPETRRFSCSLYLKQGYYDYMYAFKPEGFQEGDVAFFEGSHWETENEYTIYVYFHPLSGMYDRLVAIQDINSTQQ